SAAVHFHLGQVPRNTSSKINVHNAKESVPLPSETTTINNNGSPKADAHTLSLIQPRETEENDEHGHDGSLPHSLPCSPDLFLQLETRQISEEQLIVEVQGIYSGLVVIEKKCVEIDMQQLNGRSELSNDQWKALIGIHKTLLHEHHDFFLASQHPSATPRLRRLATEYGMLARMWRHGVHSFLELLRHRLPGSLEHMISFIYIAYSMMTLMLESIPAFSYIWIECLGDLARYQMAIEEVDLYNRENWAEVAIFTGWILIAITFSINYIGRREFQAISTYEALLYSLYVCCTFISRRLYDYFDATVKIGLEIVQCSKHSPWP
ncbi:hypothetical protein TESG_07301, partial [Trichophyton tonsurans CBS 112818]